MKINKTIVTFLILISIFFGLNFVIARNGLNSDAAIPSSSFTESSYELKPVWNKYFIEVYDIQNAYVTVNPDSKLKYRLNGYKEKLDIFEGKINHLTLAEKRILEIEKFGFKDFLLDEYVKNIDLFVSQRKDVSNSKLKNLITSHQRRIDKYIFELNDPFDTKQKYQKKADQIFYPLLKKNSERLVQYDPQKIIYSTSEILNKRDFGSYSIYSSDIDKVEELEISGKQFLPPKPLSKIDNKLFQELLANSNDKFDESLLDSRSVIVIPVLKDTKTISISYPTPDLVLGDWAFKEATKEGFFYTKKINNEILKSTSASRRRDGQIQDDKIYIKYSSKYDLLDSDKIANKELLLALTNHGISDIFIDNILPNSLQKTYEELVVIPKTETLSSLEFARVSRVTNKNNVILERSDRIFDPSEYSLTLFSARELTSEELNNISVEIYPFNNQSISLSKNDYLPWTNPISTEKSTPYFLNTAYFLSVILGIYLLWDLIKKVLGLIWKLLVRFSKKTRLVFLIILVPSILSDIFKVPQVYDTVTFWLTIFWVIVVIGYRLEGRFSFAAALSFLVICPISLIFKNEFVAEKAAIWTYMFLVVGTIQSLIELRVGGKDRVDLDEYWAKTEPLRMRLYAILKMILVPIKNKLLEFKKYLIYIFTKRRSLLGYIIFYIKTIIVVIIFVIAIFLLKLSYDKFQIEYKKYQRLQRNPVINKIEPYYVYKSTKVLMRGKLFGLKNNEKQRLMSDVGEIEYHFWDDSKIIFVMPTEWSFGEHDIWVEKNIGWDGKRETAKSNVMKIKLLPITGRFTPDDEKYFDQLKNLEKETLEINGY